MTHEKKAVHKGSFHGLSVRSHFLRMYFGDKQLASGTCFFVMSGNEPVLITNRHNFTGRHNITDEPLHKLGGIPNNAVVTLQTSEGEVLYRIDLFDHKTPDEPAWVEHPVLGAKADVIALPVAEMANIVSAKTSVELGSGEWHRWGIGSEVEVIGFPFGQISGPFPVWSKGYIASEPDYDFGNLPIFLIDCRSRTGQSGSPVFSRFRAGDIIEHDGQQYSAKQEMSCFQGIYSGRIRSDSDLGMVWKPSFLKELVDHAAQNGVQHKMENGRHTFPIPLSVPKQLGQITSDWDC